MAITEFRVALKTNDFENAVRFYRDGLGLDPDELWTDNGEGHSFFAGRAILEVLDINYADGVDRIETGSPQTSGQIRFAFEVDDIQLALQRAQKYGAVLVHEPVLTPWGDLNIRIKSPEGLQITLFQKTGKST